MQDPKVPVNQHADHNIQALKGTSHFPMFQPIVAEKFISASPLLYEMPVPARKSLPFVKPPSAGGNFPFYLRNE